MKTKLALLLILIYTLNACSSAQVTNGNKVDAFTKIASSAGIDVHFSHASSHTVKIETDEENLPKIEVFVKNESLTIKRKNGEKFKKNSSVKVYVTAPVINDIAFSGGADFYAQELKNSNKLNIAFSGGADLDIDKLEANECNIAFSGGADCEIKQANVKNLSLAFSGGSDADINITKAEKVNVAASGGADVELEGKAKNVSVSVSGGADVDIQKLTYENLSSNKSKSGELKK